jgi:serine phosphatase RsbU (regulator of sigma subunit)
MEKIHLEPAGLKHELKNFQRIAKIIKPNPGEIPSLPGIDIYGEILPLSGEVGGDHLIYIDFDKRFDMEVRIGHAISEGKVEIAQKLEETRHKAGILLADASGHSITDALLTAMLHQAFLVGASYELTLHGEITTDLFETLNTRFYQSSRIDKFITMIYGEIHQNGEFRFLSAGHPLPVVFSSEFNRLVNINQERMVIFPPVGTLPSAVHMDSRQTSSSFGTKPQYSVNTINIMGVGDVMLLFTDGFEEQMQGQINFVSAYLEDCLREIKYGSAKEIAGYLKNNFFSRIATPDDDATVVVVKKIG